VAGARLGPAETLKALRSPSRRRRIGLLGGSFNPAHGGHRRISLFARDALGLDEVWWLVSPGNPLKDSRTMAPLAARVASARAQARRAPIRVSAIERELGTCYTVDTLRQVRRGWPKADFVWLMGTDNLAQFHRWKHWRAIARAMPIAAIARPGYAGAAFASPAMAWLGGYRTSAASLRRPERWSAPALVLLTFDPDRRSATQLRRDDPDWASRWMNARQRDGLTRRLILPDRGGSQRSSGQPR
jgi:nicotinate-nucleotide adenylyltransferase